MSKPEAALSVFIADERFSSDELDADDRLADGRLAADSPFSAVGRAGAMRVDLAAARQVARHVLLEERVPANTEVAVMFVDGEQMARYNRRFLGRQGPTDVLAFPLQSNQAGRPPVAEAGGPPLGLGDVFICPEVVAGNAAASGVPIDDEMALMVVHGILHLLGWDHQNDDEAALMEARERELLAGMGRSRP